MLKSSDMHTSFHHNNKLKEKKENKTKTKSGGDSIDNVSSPAAEFNTIFQIELLRN